MHYGITATIKGDDDLRVEMDTVSIGDLIDALMDSLFKRGAVDPAVSVSSDRVIEIEVLVEGTNVLNAMDRAAVIVGGAIIDGGGRVGEVTKEVTVPGPGEVLYQEDLARSAAEERITEWKVSRDTETDRDGDHAYA